MKNYKLVLAIFSIAMLSMECFAGPKKAKKEIVTVEYITDVECDHCVEKVMNFMPFQKGVKDVEAELKTGIVTVSYDKRKTSDEAVVKLFEKIDINAEVKPEPKKEAQE